MRGIEHTSGTFSDQAQVWAKLAKKYQALIKCQQLNRCPNLCTWRVEVRNSLRIPKASRTFLRISELKAAMKTTIVALTWAYQGTINRWRSLSEMQKSQLTIGLRSLSRIKLVTSFKRVRIIRHRCLRSKTQSLTMLRWAHSITMVRKETSWPTHMVLIEPREVWWDTRCAIKATVWIIGCNSIHPWSRGMAPVVGRVVWSRYLSLLVRMAVSDAVQSLSTWR